MRALGLEPGARRPESFRSRLQPADHRDDDESGDIHDIQPEQEQAAAAVEVTGRGQADERGEEHREPAVGIELGEAVERQRVDRAGHPDDQEEVENIGADDVAKATGRERPSVPPTPR